MDADIQGAAAIHTDLLELPDNALVLVLQHLDGIQLVRFAQVCKQARLLAEQEQLWERLCLCHGITGEEWRAATFRHTYGHLVHKLGYLHGTFYSPDKPYGAVVRIKPVPPCDLQARFLVVPSLKGPVVWLPLFKVEAPLPGGRPGGVTCARSASASMSMPAFAASVLHDASLQRGGPGEARCFSLKCCRGCEQSELEMLARHVWPGNTTVPGEAEGADASACPPLDSSVPEALPPNPDSSLVNLLYAHHYTPMFYQQEGSDVQRLGLRPLLVPQRSTHPLAGIWRGTYGSHGYEVIRLEVQEGHLLTGTKLTGDYNVPAGEVTFRADLQAGQAAPQAAAPAGPDAGAAAGSGSTSPAGEAGTSSGSSSSSGELFQLPEGFAARADFRLGSHQLRVRWRLPAEGHIAHVGYSSASWTPAELVAFSDDCFALLWTELRSCSLFTRLLL